MSPPQDLSEAASLRNGGVPRFRDSPSSWTGAQWMSGFCLMCARHGTECASRNAPRGAWHRLLAGSQPYPPGCSERGAFCSCPQCRCKEGLLSVSGVTPPPGPTRVSELHSGPPRALAARAPGAPDQAQQPDLQQRWCPWEGRGWEGAGGGLGGGGPPGRMASRSSLLPASIPSASCPAVRGEESWNTGQRAEGSVQHPSSEGAAGRSGSPRVTSPRRESSHK